MRLKKLRAVNEALYSLNSISMAESLSFKLQWGKTTLKGLQEREFINYKINAIKVSSHLARGGVRFILSDFSFFFSPTQLP